MTKVTKLNLETVSERSDNKKRPIKFVKWVNDFEGKVEDTSDHPGMFDTVMLIARYESGYDTIAAWHEEDEHDNVCVYLGHWNDGIV